MVIRGLQVGAVYEARCSVERPAALALRAESSGGVVVGVADGASAALASGDGFVAADVADVCYVHPSTFEVDTDISTGWSSREM